MHCTRGPQDKGEEALYNSHNVHDCHDLHVQSPKGLENILGHIEAVLKPF